MEVVKGNDTDSFIGSFQRFVNGRGKPRDVYSDCGTNLKGTKSELNIKMQRIKYSPNKQITWHFNPPAAPHMGGIWERLIRTVKNVMFSMIKNSSDRLSIGDNIYKEENGRKWPLARIVHVVKVKTMTGEYVEPAENLFLLECDSNFEVHQGGGC